MADKKDFSINISFNAGKTEAHIFIAPPLNGGRDVGIQDIKNALEHYGVVFGINNDIIESIVLNQRYSQKILIASAQLPVDGENGTISYKYARKVSGTPIENEFGFVNYKDLGLIRTVHKGDVIADITPPTEGVPGTDVTGGVIRPYPGKKASYTVGPNTGLTEDGLHIIATADGNIVFRSGAFTVDTVVTVKGDVDPSVGNIDFIGDVIIKGNVFEGYKISSGGNITVDGEVNGAVIEADGDVLIKKGCINSTVTAHRSFSAMFCEHVKLKCDGDVSAQNFVICDIYCGGKLDTKGSNGGIVGGRYVILNSIEVANIGSRAYPMTDITLGDNAMLAEEKQGLLVKIAQLKKTLTDLTLVVNFLNEKKKALHRLPDDKEAILGNAVRQKVLLNVEITNANKRIEEIDLSLQVKQRLTVSCKGYIYPGVKITINDASFKVESEFVHSVVGLSQDGQITISPYV